MQDNKKKDLLLSLISKFSIIVILILSILLIHSINKSRKIDNKIEKELYATISEVGNDYIKVTPIDEELGSSLTIKTDAKYYIGDFIYITFDEIDKILTPNSIKIIASANEVSTTTKKVETTKKAISSKTSKTTTKVISTTKEDNDSLVLAYVENVNDEVSSYNDSNNLKDKAKSTFITIVDFIFYDGKIKDVTWKELSNKTKAKVIYYTLLIDNKIDNKWPNYKDDIGDKYNDLKAKLLAKYMDITTAICTNKTDECMQIKEDFKLLKSSLSLTWDIIKNAFKYGYEKSTTYLKNWYEVFSGK